MLFILILVCFSPFIFFKKTRKISLYISIVTLLLFLINYSYLYFKQKLTNSDGLVATLHFSHFQTFDNVTEPFSSNYYLLNSFNDNKKYLKKILELKDIIVLDSIKLKKGNFIIFINSDKNFNQDTYNYSDGINWEYILKESLVASFEIDTVEHNKLRYMNFSQTNQKAIIQKAEFNSQYECSVYYDYDEIDRIALQEIYNRVSYSNYQKKNEKFTYKIYFNDKSNVPDAIFLFEDFGKLFQFYIF